MQEKSRNLALSNATPNNSWKPSVAAQTRTIFFFLKYNTKWANTVGTNFTPFRRLWIQHYIPAEFKIHPLVFFFIKLSVKVGPKNDYREDKFT